MDSELVPQRLEGQDHGEQLALPDIDEERQRLYERLKTIGQSAVEALTRDYTAARFSYADLAEFARQDGKSPQEAGKMFKRFYQGLMEANLEPLPKDYESSRDALVYPLWLLSLVLSEMPENYDDAYDKLLRQYHSERSDQLLVKKTTSS